MKKEQLKTLFFRETEHLESSLQELAIQQQRLQQPPQCQQQPSAIIRKSK